MPTEDFNFHVVEKPWKVPSSGESKAYLVRDNWDDYDQFETSFRLFVFDETGAKHEIGNLKIGTFGLKGASKTDAPAEGMRKPQIDDTFAMLNINSFSLGQDDSYYTRLMNLNAGLRKTILKRLRDLAADEEIWIRAISEAVVVKSLLRSVSKKTVEGQFRRILAGLPRLTPFYLEYKRIKSEPETQGQLSLKFQVVPFKHPPQNIHVLIGRNGVGKSHLLYSMTKAFLGKNLGEEYEGEILMQDEWGNISEPITNLVSVSFSAFDPFETYPDSESSDGTVAYTYIGLRQNNVENNRQAPPKTFNDLAIEFSQSLRACLPDDRAQRWKRLVATLETDPLFKEADVKALIDFQEDKATFLKETCQAFERLSSGHKIVLLKQYGSRAKVAGTECLNS